VAGGAVGECFHFPTRSLRDRPSPCRGGLDGIK
jgi:hypothetical protein